MDRFLIHTQGWIKGFYPASLLITVHQECWSDTTVLAEMLQRNALNSWMCTITIRPPNGQHWQHQLVSINIALQANYSLPPTHTFHVGGWCLWWLWAANFIRGQYAVGDIYTDLHCSLSNIMNNIKSHTCSMCRLSFNYCKWLLMQ